jgi:hypothetical protein
MHSNESNIVGLQTKILVICLRSSRDEVSRVISNLASLDWRKEGYIHLHDVEDSIRERKGLEYRSVVELSGEQMARVNKIAPPESGARIIVVGRIASFNYTSDGRSVDYVSNQAFEKRLTSLLGQCGLDWKTQISNKLQHYHPVSTGIEQLEQWLEQFKKCDQEWIGVALLKMLDFWPSSKINDALFEKPKGGNGDWLREYDRIVYNETSTGKSSAIVSRAVKQRLSGEFMGHITPFGEFMEILKNNNHLPQKFLFLEDCIMTGQEAIALVDSLKNFRGLGMHKIDLKFAVGTEYGISRLRKYLSQNEISSISIIQPQIGHIPNLSKSGEEARKNNMLFDDKFNLCSSSYVINGIHLRGATAFSSDNRKRICNFCKKIGKQLILENTNLPGPILMQVDTVARDHGLGFGNLGLMTAFAHHIPDNVVPLFKLGGKVSFERQFFEWVPLFVKFGDKDMWF